MTGRSLRQEELDAYHRQDFICKVMDAMTPYGFMKQGPVVRFLIHKQNYSLVALQCMGGGEFEFSVADKARYAYKLSLVVDFLEQLYASGAEVIALQGEAAISAHHATANADAEPDTTV